MNAIYSLLVALLWAIGIIINKKIITYLNSPALALTLTSIIATITCIIYVLVYERQNIEISWKIILLVLAAGTIGSFLPNIIFFNLLKKNPSYLVAALAYTTPLIVLLITVFYYRERLDVRHVIGVVLIVMGVILCLSKNGLK